MEGNLEKLLKSTITINSIGNRAISLNKPNIKKGIQTLKNFHPINTFYKNIVIDPKLEYKPRRKYNFTSTEVPLIHLGKSKLNLGKSFFTGINLSQNEIMTNKELSNDLEFKTNYILKYAQNADNFYKLEKNNIVIREEKRRIYDEIYNKIRKALENQTRLFFDNKNFSGNISSLLVKNLIIFCFDFNNNINHFCNFLVSELKNEKEQNMKLLKKNYEQELKLQSKIKELDELNKYLIRYDVSNKILLKKTNEESLGEIKGNFFQKENSYLITIYKLEQEIKDLTKLLAKNKDYYNKFKEFEKIIEEKNNLNDEMRFAFNKEINEKNVQYAIEKDKEEELLMKMKDMEIEFNKFKKEEEIIKLNEIELNSQIKRLKCISEEKNERIRMLNEELEYFMYHYQKEKKEHGYTYSALQALEKKVLKEKEEKEKEEREKKIEEEKTIKEEDEKKIKEEEEKEKKE
jgi:hypothetical protein